MVHCGFCGENGHSIRNCSKSGASEVQQQRADRLASKRNESIMEQKGMYSVTSNPLDSASPKPTMGGVKSDWAKKCSTPDDVVHSLLPMELMQQMLLHINRNLNEKNSIAEFRSNFPSKKKVLL